MALSHADVHDPQSLTMSCQRIMRVFFILHKLYNYDTGILNAQNNDNYLEQHTILTTLVPIQQHEVGHSLRTYFIRARDP